MANSNPAHNSSRPKEEGKAVNNFLRKYTQNNTEAVSHFTVTHRVFDVANKYTVYIPAAMSTASP